MGRTAARPASDRGRVLIPARRLCPACGRAMRMRYENRRTLATLSGLLRLRLKVRRCEREGCARHRVPYRPEAEGALALPQHEFAALVRHFLPSSDEVVKPCLYDAGTDRVGSRVQDPLHFAVPIDQRIRSLDLLYWRYSKEG